MVAHAFWGQLLCARPGTETHAWIRTRSKLRRGSHHPSLQVKKLTGEVEVHASPPSPPPSRGRRAWFTSPLFRRAFVGRAALLLSAPQGSPQPSWVPASEVHPLSSQHLWPLDVEERLFPSLPESRLPFR